MMKRDWNRNERGAAQRGGAAEENDEKKKKFFDYMGRKRSKLQIDLSMVLFRVHTLSSAF